MMLLKLPCDQKFYYNIFCAKELKAKITFMISDLNNLLKFNNFYIFDELVRNAYLGVKSRKVKNI